MTGVTTPSNVRAGTVSDPVALRALAHPLRQELYGLVAREGALTAADAARQLGISHALASHHLRQLAKYGYLEPADTEQNRARPWRVVSTSLAIRPADEAGAATRDALARTDVARSAQELAAWQRRDPADREAWPEAGTSSGLLYLTPAEFAELQEAFHARFLQLADRRPVGHPDARPADAVPVSVLLVAVPVPPTEHGG